MGTVHLKAIQNGGLGATAWPMRTFRQSVLIEFEPVANNEEVDVLGVTYVASLQDFPGVTWPRLISPFSLRPLQGPNPTLCADVVLPFEVGLINRIEDWRQGMTGPVRFQVRFNVDAHLRDARMPQIKAQIDQQSVLDISVTRDDWLPVLKQLEWGVFQVIEIPSATLSREKRFKEALEILDRGVAAMRGGDWPAAVTHARRALEAAAHVANPDGDNRQAFRDLLESAIPGEENAPKREALSGLMSALTPLRNQTAHGRNLRSQIGRAEAELSITVAAAVFRYMGAVAKIEEE